MDLSGWVAVGLGANCDCRCGILYAPMLGGGGGLTEFTSPYISVLSRHLAGGKEEYHEQIQRGGGG